MMDKDLVVIQNNQAVTSSKKVAEKFGKEHFHVLRDIDAFKKDVSNFGEMFYETELPDSYGRPQRAYLINKKGFQLLAMGFTGSKAIKWKLEYIDTFDAMDKALQEQQNTMTQTEIVAANAIRLVEQERELKAIRAKQEAQEEALQSMRDVITINHESWRKETTALLNKIAQKRGDDYMTVRHESYVALNERMGVSVEIRLKNARDRMIENGYSKSRINQLNVLDIIEQDKKLVEGYLAVVKDMAIKYGVA